ncbi:uncharacterized protein DUF2514, partial [Pseudomonas duriflava]
TIIPEVLIKWALAIAIALGCLFGAYRYGVNTTNAKWEKQQSDAQAAQATLRATEEREARAKEQARQAEIEKIRTMPRSRSKPQKLMLVMLTLLLSACVNRQIVSPSLSVAAPAIPELPTEARQSPTPAFCLPTCSAALMQERESWLKKLTELEPLALPASVLSIQSETTNNP